MSERRAGDDLSAGTSRRVTPRTNIADQLNAIQDDTKHPGRVIASKPITYLNEPAESPESPQ